MTTATASRQHEGQLNSVQLNIVTYVDLQKAVEAGSLQNALYMMDNSVGGVDQGTARLQTVCKQGQVLNWIIYPMVTDRRPDGTWPPMPRINNIVFLDSEAGDEEDVAEQKVCVDFKIYGGPDRIRNRYTPVYYYWAGTVARSLPPGIYRYRFVLELEREHGQQPLFLNSAENPSIRVLEI